MYIYTYRYLFISMSIYIKHLCGLCVDPRILSLRFCPLRIRIVKIGKKIQGPVTGADEWSCDSLSGTMGTTDTWNGI